MGDGGSNRIYPVVSHRHLRHTNLSIGTLRLLHLYLFIGCRDKSHIGSYSAYGRSVYTYFAMQRPRPGDSVYSSMDAGEADDVSHRLTRAMSSSVLDSRATTRDKIGIHWADEKS